MSETRILEWPQIKKEAVGFVKVNAAGKAFRGETAALALERGREEGFQGGAIWALRWLGAVPVLNPITMAEDGLAVLDDSVDRCPWCRGPVILVPFTDGEWWVNCTSALCDARGPKGYSQSEAAAAFRSLATPGLCEESPDHCASSSRSGGEVPS